MTNVFLKPWVGENYAQEGYKSKKILVVGDSHYCNKEDCEKWKAGCGDWENKCSNKDLQTKNIVTWYLDCSPAGEKRGARSEGWMRTYDTFTDVFHGEKCSYETLQDFWNSIVYYVYVQRAVPSHTKAPSSELYQKSEKAFFEILAEYKPDVVFVWGMRIWAHNKFPNGIRLAGKAIHDDRGGCLAYYNDGVRDIPVYRLGHPSHNSLKMEDSKKIQEVLRMA